MGTTLTACLIRDDSIEIANVGDSCCFGINEEEIVKLTKDHSLVQELIDSGSLTEEEGRNHPKKNIITRAIGAQSDIKPDFFEVKLRAGDRIFMCTDGVSNMPTDEEILEILNEEGTEEEKVDRIIAMANEHGGRDNMGIVLVTPEV